MSPLARPSGISFGTEGALPPSGIGFLFRGFLGSGLPPPISLSSLPIWAQGLFTDTCNLYRPLPRVFSSTGMSKAGPGYELAYTNVPCHYGPTANISDNQPGIGRAKRPTLFTEDGIWFPPGQEIGDNWAIKNRSRKRDGSPKQQYGTIHLTQGEPKLVDSVSDVIDCAHIECEIFTPADVPGGVA